MNKILILIQLCFVCISCSKSHDLTSTLHKVLVNKTEKSLVHILNTNVGVDTITSYGMDSLSVSFVKVSRSDSDLFGTGHDRAPLVEVYGEVTYNLSDTTKIEYSISYCDYSQLGTSAKDSIYGSKLVFILDDLSTDSKPIIYAKWYFDEDILSLMTKDYSMLDLFKDYYQR